MEQILWAVTDWVASTSASEAMGETDSFIWLFVAESGLSLTGQHNKGCPGLLPSQNLLKWLLIDAVFLI